MKKFLFFLIPLLFLFSSCQKDQLDDVLFIDQPQVEWGRQQLLNMGFHDHDIVEYDEYFVIDDDMVINKSAFANPMDPNSVDFRQRQTPFIVDQNTITDVRVQIDAGFNAHWQGLIRQALDDWNAPCYRVSFREVTTNPHLIIYEDTNSNLPTIYQNLASSKCGKAELPPGNGDPGSIVSINTDASKMNNDPKRLYVITHEIGHTIGLDHTNLISTGSIHIPGTPTNDGNSIMASGLSCGNTGSISPDDRLALKILYPCSNWGGWTDDSDLSLVGDITGDGEEELILINTSYTGGAIRTVDLATGNDLHWINHGNFQGWMDPTDHVFLADANNDDRKDLIFQNTRYLDGAVRIVDLATGNNINSISHGTFQGWMDETDKSFVGDVNGDGRADLILVNNNQSGTSINGAIRVIDLITENTISTINHGNFQGWMNPTDKLFLGDANDDGRDDLIFLNTSYTDGAFRVVDLITGLNISSMSHSDPLAVFQGWMDETDKSFVGDANGDGRDDLILVNNNQSGTSISGGARVVDLITKNTISTINDGFQGWVNPTDRMFVGDANGDNNVDLVFQNTHYTDGALRVLNLMTGLNINSISHGTFGGWMDSPDSSLLCDSDGNGAKSILFINKDPNKCGGVIRVVDLISENDLLWIDYCD